MSYDFLKQRVIVPSGKCPAVLEETTEEAVLKWINQIIEATSSTQLYLPSAYKYWARQIFFNDREKTEKVIKVINEKLGERNVYDELSSD